MKLCRFPLRAQAAELNKECLERLAGKSIKYIAKDTRGLYEDGSEIKHKEGKNPLDELNVERYVCLKVSTSFAFLRVMSSTNHLAGCTGDAYEGTTLNVRK